ncbi:uncharacterized protein CELE_B0041.12, partial [Caenorhabditis elegans]
VELKAKLLDF